MISVEMKTMAEHIHEHRRHALPIAYHLGTVKLGAVDYLPKPFERERILEAIRGVLGKQSVKA